jgi:hypothetical protein
MKTSRSSKANKTSKVVAREVKSAIMATRERKNYSVTATYQNTVAGVVSPLSQGLVQGDTLNTRTGYTIFPLKLQLNYSFLSGAGSTNSLHRIIVFADKLNQGTLPTVVQVLDGAVYNSTYALLNKQQSRFKILYDKMHGVVGAGNSAATHAQLVIKLKGQIFYNGTANVAADNGPHSLFVMTLTDSVAVSTATVSFYSSLFYVDD